MDALAQWIARAAQGEEEAFRELYRRYRPAVVRLVKAFAALDDDDLEDVVQETFTRAFKALPGLSNPRAFEPWLLTIARNRACTHTARIESRKSAQALLEHELPKIAGLFPEALEREVEAAVVKGLIDELPAGKERETVQLFYLQGGLSARQIAEQQGVGKSAVTMRLERFRARVKKELLRRLLERSRGAP